MSTIKPDHWIVELLDATHARRVFERAAELRRRRREIARLVEIRRAARFVC